GGPWWSRPRGAACSRPPPPERPWSRVPPALKPPSRTETPASVTPSTPVDWSRGRRFSHQWNGHQLHFPPQPSLQLTLTWLTFPGAGTGGAPGPAACATPAPAPP